MNKSKLIWTIVAVLILLFGGGAIGYLYFSVIPQKEDELVQVKAARDVSKRKLLGPDTNPVSNRDSLLSIEEDLKLFEDDLKSLVQRVPHLTRSEYDKFADELDDLRKRSGVSVWNAKWIKASKPRATRGLAAKTWPATMHKVQYNMDVTGSFFQLLRYVRMLEKETRFVSVSKFSISPGSSSDDSNALERKMDLILYSFTYREPDKALEIEIPEKEYSKTTAIPD